MKHIKQFENFRINEELSIRSGILPILSSLFITLSSLDVSAANSTPFIGKEHFTKELRDVNSDLNKLKNQVEDPELLDIINSLEDLQSRTWRCREPHQIPVICEMIEKFINKNNIYDTTISDSLNHIRENDFIKLENDYKNLLEIYDTAWSQDKKGSYIIITIILLIFISMFIITKL